MNEHNPNVPAHQNARVSRADLLRFLDEYDAEKLKAAAPFFGFYPPHQPEAPAAGQVIYTEQKPSEPQKKEEYLFLESQSKPGFWAMVDRKLKKKPENEEDDKPKWTEGKGFEPEEVRSENYSGQNPDKHMVSHSRIWPLLKSLLGMNVDSGKVDMDETIARISRLEPLEHLPRKPKVAWRPSAFLLLDFAGHLLPFWRDQHLLLDWIVKDRGSFGLDMVFLDKGPGNKGLRPYGNNLSRTGWKFPESNTAFLLMSDLGCLDSSGNALKTWLRFGLRFRNRGLKPLVLTPCPPDLWDKRLLSFFTLIYWDRGIPFPRPDRQNRIQCSIHSSRQRAGKKDREKNVSKLLSLLSPAIRIEPELLRAIRMSLPQKNFDAGVEAAVWNHPDVIPGPGGCFIHPDQMEKYQQKFSENSKGHKELAIGLTALCHAHLSPAIKHEEALIAAALTGKKPPLETIKFFQKFYRTVDDNPYRAKMEKSWFNRLSARLEGMVWQENSEHLTPVWMKIYGPDWENQKKQLPKGADPAHALWHLSPKKKALTLHIYQKGRELIIFDEQQSPSVNIKGFLCAAYIATICADQYISVAGKKLKPEHVETIQLPEKGPLEIDSDLERLLLNLVEKPSQAQSLGQDQKGLFITLPDDIPENRIYYNWGKLGNDKFGIYSVYDLNGVEFVMRWIKPGTFMMGSPENEPERDEDEIWHEVTLTQGFWLAETACTQELWKAVMGENPGNFKGNDRPVDSVSWEDVQIFLEKLNELIPGVEFRLPTEAEWEYACRAGTTTPFSFGDNITTDQVNFDGNNPYAGGKEGEYRKKTVNVKSLPSNDWGLYEMHGNVWEWCSDWFEEYDLNKTTNPTGSDTGEERVLRGGGWLHYGRLCRSAFRFWSHPAIRYRNFGFRLAQGHQAGQQVKAGSRWAEPVPERGGAAEVRFTPPAAEQGGPKRKKGWFSRIFGGKRT
jgi:formylglycine-generating enzyme required for sulfatase activity